MSDKPAIVNAPANIVSIHGKNSWAKRENEAMDKYSVFTLFLHSEYDNPIPWIDALEDVDLKQMPNGLQSAPTLKKVAAQFLWKMRKNDFQNEIVFSAQRKYQHHLDKTGGSISNLAKKLALLANKSIDKKLLEFEKGTSDMTIAEAMALVKISADLEVQLQANRDFDRKTVSLKETPIHKIKQLLGALGED